MPWAGSNTMEDVMSIGESSIRSVVARGTLPLRLSGAILHWDGIGTAVRCWRLPEAAIPASPALSWPLAALVGPGGPELVSPTPAIAWAGEAAPLTVYLAPLLLAHAAQ